jgi:hypothetical protein
MARTPAAPKASVLSRRLQSILRRIRENGIQCERAYVRRQLQQLSKLEDTMDGYSKGILQEIRSHYLKKKEPRL